MKINLPDKLYYSIGEVALAFGVNASLLRYWEKEFPILNPKKNKKGTRYFTPEDTLDGARIALVTNDKIEESVNIIERLEFVKSELNKLKNSLIDKEQA